jgi:hypothetical protein
MKLRHTIADRVAGFVRDWSLPRQFAGEDPTREAAQSTIFGNCALGSKRPTQSAPASVPIARSAALSWFMPDPAPPLRHLYAPKWSSGRRAARADVFVKIAEALARNSGRERTGTICYAVGWTHHTTGVQTIRAAAIIQGLLGNVGRPRGGILALRGHSSIQGSTDIPTLYNMLPTYLPQPNAFKPHNDIKGLSRP